MTSKFATACAAFAAAAQALQLTSLALDSAPIKRVVNYPNIHNFEASEGTVEVEWIDSLPPQFDGYDTILFNCAPDPYTLMKESPHMDFYNPAHYPEESNLDGRLEKIRSVVHEYKEDMGKRGLSETYTTIFRPLTTGENIMAYDPNPEISQAVYKDAARFICTTYESLW